MISNLLSFYDKLPISIRLLISAFCTAVPFYSSAFLSFHLSQRYPKLPTFSLWVHAAIFLSLLTIVVFFYRYIAFMRELQEKAMSRKIAAIMHAHAQSERLIIKDIMKQNSRNPSDLFSVSINDLQEIVQAAYNTFEASFGTSKDSASRVDFEVTFMTKSYDDDEITIPASANRDGRSPISMLKRKDEKKIYNNTVTAQVYREVRPHIHIIEDTANPDAGYQEIYSGQSDRIKSSIIYPVLSDKNVLLGTLVVHCDMANFFKKIDRKYWTDILEIFAKKLALVKLKFDLIFKHSGASEPINLSIQIPPIF